MAVIGSLLRVSNYAHVIQKGSKFVFINSLFLKPLVSDLDEYVLFNSLVTGERNINSLTESEKQFISALERIKVLVKSEDVDKSVINNIRSTIGNPCPTVVYFIVTEKCNFNCRYCFVNDSLESNHAKKEIMTSETAINGWEFFKKKTLEGNIQSDSERHVIIYGGEPLTNFETVVQLLNTIQKDISAKKIPYKVNVTINTNGSLLDDEKIELLKKYGVTLAISLDGSKESNVDRVFATGEETFDTVYSNIEKAVKQSANTSLSITLNHKAINHFEDTINTILKLNVKNIGYNLLMPRTDNKLDSNYSVNASKFLIDSYKLLKNNGIYEDRIMRKINAFMKRELYIHDCAATGGAQLVIAPNGDIGLCQGLLGNKMFKISSLQEDFDFENNETVRKWANRSPIFLQTCQKCRALGICGGGCPKNSIVRYGDINYLDENFCTHTKMTFDWLLDCLVNSLNENTND